MRYSKLAWRILYGTGIVGGTSLALRKNDWDVSSIGAVRFGRAAYTVFSIIGDYKVGLRNIDPVDEGYEEKKSEVHLKAALKLHKLCCDNAGAFIKVGQYLGSLDYLLPKEYIKTLKVLLDRAPQSSLTDLFKVIKEDLGRDASELFESFDPEPLGTASLAQVHKAVLRDGRVVAVKIQHPKVKAHSFVDIETMHFLVRCVAFLFPEFQYGWLGEETKKNLPRELDFRHEARNCERVARLFKHFNFLKVPKVYWELSSERVLTMEFCEGGKVDDKKYMEEHNISVSEVTRDLGKLYSEMIFVQGYVHCDPHPGNVLVKKTKQGAQIVLLDHGLYQILTDEFRVNYSKLWLGIIRGDVANMKKYATALNAGDLYVLFACILTARSWKAISSGLDKVEFTEAESREVRASVSNFMVEISDILNRVPREMLLILKTNDVLRGIESSLETRANATSFINMTRCCIRAMATDDHQKCDNWICHVKVTFAMQWELCKINFYELFLWLQSSSIGQVFSHNRNRWSS